MFTKVKKAVETGTEPLQNLYLFAWLIILLAGVISPLIISWMESAEATRGIAIWTVLVVILILFFGPRPTNLGWAAILGSAIEILNRIGTPRAAGAPSLRNPFVLVSEAIRTVAGGVTDGTAAGVTFLLRVVVHAAFGTFTLGLLAIVWDWRDVNGGFAAVWFVLFGFALWGMLHPSGERWYERLTLALLVISAINLVWQSFDPKTATAENWFDDNNGGAKIVGYYDASGDFQPDPKSRSAKACINGCYYKGIRLVTPKPEDAPDTSGFGIGTIVDFVTQTGKERANATNQTGDDTTIGSGNTIIMTPEPKPAVFTDIRELPVTEERSFFVTALETGDLVEAIEGTLFADGEDLVLTARSDACFSTNLKALVKVVEIDSLTVDPETKAVTEGPDGVADAYRISSRNGGTVTGVKIWRTKDKKAFQRYTCNKSTTT